jgi:hypothetical protein
MGINPEIGAPFSGGGFSRADYFPLPDYQAGAVHEFLNQLGNTYQGLYKCVRCLDLNFSYLVFRAALWVVATPTSPRNRLGSQPS